MDIDLLAIARIMSIDQDTERLLVCCADDGRLRGYGAFIRQINTVSVLDIVQIGVFDSGFYCPLQIRS